MVKSSKITPKVKKAFGSEKVEESIQALSDQLIDALDFKNDDVAVVGIQTRGATLATRLTERMQKKVGKEIPLGAIDITLYRDDFSTKAISPVIGETHLDFPLDDKTIVLVDDVLFTGRTIRAALDEIMDFGRPKRVILAVLVDRGLRELPIQADFSAIQIKTSTDESVIVKLRENDGTDDLIVCEPVSG